MPWTILLTHWRTILLVSVLAYGAIMTMRVQTLTAQRDEARATLESYKIQQQALSDAARKQSEKAVKEIRSEIPQLVAQAEKSAYSNYMRKYGLSRCERLPNLPASGDGGKAEGAKGIDAARPESILNPVEQLAIDCGKTTVLYEAWQSWAIKNDLGVQ